MVEDLSTFKCMIYVCVTLSVENTGGRIISNIHVVVAVVEVLRKNS